jgi:hypothetical protein
LFIVKHAACASSFGLNIIAGSSLNPVPFPSAGEIHKPGVTETLFRRYRNVFEESFLPSSGSRRKPGGKSQKPILKPPNL